MDPNANLNEQMELAETILEDYDLGEDSNIEENARRLAELVVALNGWLTSGGFLPQAWSKP